MGDVHLEQFLAQSVVIQLWMLLTCCVLLVALFGLLVVVLFLRPSASPIDDSEEYESQLAVLEERLAGVIRRRAEPFAAQSGVESGYWFHRRCEPSGAAGRSWALACSR